MAAHFLTSDLNIALPSSYDCNIEYVPKYNSTKELTKYREKSQRQLDHFWEAWRQDYLLTLRETLPLFHQGSWSQIVTEVKISVEGRPFLGAQLLRHKSLLTVSRDLPLLRIHGLFVLPPRWGGLGILILLSSVIVSILHLSNLSTFDLMHWTPWEW